MKRVILFAGAGASKAVDARAYPTTIEFFELLPTEITEDHLFKTMVEFRHQEEKDEQTIDIEVVLWRLEELRAGIENLNNRHPLGWFLSRISGPLEKAIQQVRSHTTSTRPKIQRLVDLINEQVYRLYAKIPAERKLKRTWIPLLKGLSARDIHLEIFTTNYDVVLESAVKKFDDVRIEMGWGDDEVYRSLDLSVWEEPESDSDSEGDQAQPGMLTKLHGSVNWTKTEEGIFVSDPTFKGSHERHPIIYPGFKGRPESEPFKAFHQHFMRSLLRANIAVFIGFAFRDEHINDLCARFLNPDADVVLVNPERIEVAEMLDREVIPLEMGFSRESTDVVLELVSAVE